MCGNEHPFASYFLGVPSGSSGYQASDPSPTAPGVTSDARMYAARASLEEREGDEKKAVKILQAGH